MRSTTEIPLRPRRRMRSRGLAHAVLICVGVLMVAPFAWQVIVSLSTAPQAESVPPTLWPGVLQFHNFVDVFAAMPFLQQLSVTIAITTIRTVAQVALCAMAAYAFARIRFPGRGILFALVLSIIMVPPQIFLIPQYQIVQAFGWLNSIAGIVAPGLFSAVGTFLLRQYFLGLPDELEDAARLDGANTGQIFLKIMLPLARPAMSAFAILVVLWSWNDLFWPLIVTSQPEAMPLAAGLATFQGAYQTNFPLLMAASLMATAPVLIAFVFLQRRVIAGLAFSGGK